MNQIVTKGIILRRINYGEADRIVTLLTPDQGKLSLIAKGARRIKSKLAGGIELFSVSSITFIRGRSSLGTLVSSRLDTHFGTITKDIERVQLGYQLIKMLDKITEDDVEVGYYDLLEASLSALNNPEVSSKLIELWFTAQLMKLNGHSPNLSNDLQGHKLKADTFYNFDLDKMTFVAHTAGNFDANAIKFMRLLCGESTPSSLMHVQGVQDQIACVWPLVTLWQRQYIL